MLSHTPRCTSPPRPHSSIHQGRRLRQESVRAAGHLPGPPLLGPRPSSLAAPTTDRTFLKAEATRRGVGAGRLGGHGCLVDMLLPLVLPLPRPLGVGLGDGELVLLPFPRPMPGPVCSGLSPTVAPSLPETQHVSSGRFGGHLSCPASPGPITVTSRLGCLPPALSPLQGPGGGLHWARPSL